MGGGMAPAASLLTETPMNATIVNNLPAAIRKLARVYDDRQLESLLLDYAADCRGLTSDRSQLHTASELLRVRDVARALANMCELNLAAIEPVVRDVLLPHPRRESALQLIDEYARDADHFNKLQHERERSKVR